MHFKKTALFSLSAAALMGAGIANAAQAPSVDSGFSMTVPTQSDLISPLPKGAEKLEPQIEGQTITGTLHSVKEDGKLSVEFAKDHSLVMNDGCNIYTTTYEVAKDGTISVGEFNSTRAACDEHTQQLSDALLGLFESKPSFFNLPGGTVALGSEEAAVEFTVAK
ncbi:META domain-containing protein [uncultured Corynebacterium sp.]|uniref:META domain-containing protein n=1 Tax=uncultured Corynebacterium sp. TaxID=159447 RepID=UPI00258DE7BA|nr:META domain-containing protein [uncultured Corynebacterium sp.]